MYRCALHTTLDEHTTLDSPIETGLLSDFLNCSEFAEQSSQMSMCSGACNETERTRSKVK